MFLIIEPTRNEVLVKWEISRRCTVQVNLHRRSSVLRSNPNFSVFFFCKTALTRNVGSDIRKGSSGQCLAKDIIVSLRFNVYAQGTSPNASRTVSVVSRVDQYWESVVVIGGGIAESRWWSIEWLYRIGPLTACPSRLWVTHSFWGKKLALLLIGRWVISCNLADYLIARYEPLV